MGLTPGQFFSLLLLIPLFMISCYDRKPPEISVRNSKRTDPSADSKPIDSSADSKPIDSSVDSKPIDSSADSKPNKKPDTPPSNPDQNTTPDIETRTSVISIGNIGDINGSKWVAAMVTITDAQTGDVKVAETIQNQGALFQFKLPLGQYLITLEYFANAEKTQNLARSCEAERGRIHKVEADVYNPEILICTPSHSTVTPDTADVVIQPVIVRLLEGGSR